MKKFLYELSKKIILIITRERNVPIILFISLLLFIFLFFSYDYFYPITRDTSIFIKPIPESKSKPEEIEKNNLRHLEDILNTSDNNDDILNATNDFLYLNNNDTNNININTNNSIIENEDYIFLKVKKIKCNLTEKILLYEFVKSISTGFYYGDWDNFQIKKSKFHQSKGEGYLNFIRKADQNYILNLGNTTNSSRITGYLTLKDGEYIDDYLECNFTFTLEDIKIIDLKNESINIILYDVPISYSWEEYIDSGKTINLNHSFINITFYKRYRQFQDYM